LSVASFGSNLLSKPVWASIGLYIGRPNAPGGHKLCKRPREAWLWVGLDLEAIYSSLYLAHLKIESVCPVLPVGSPHSTPEDLKKESLKAEICVAIPCCSLDGSLGRTCYAAAPLNLDCQTLNTSARLNA
jgi:hypothetical protein